MTVPVPGSLTYTYVEDGVTTVFPYPVRFLEPGELTVIREDAEGAQATLIYNVDYTVSGAGNPSGGSITRTAVTSGGKITITRSTEAKQLVDLQDAQRNPAEAVELQLDRLTMVDQEHRRDIGRAWKAGYGAEGKRIDAVPPGHFHSADDDGNLVDAGLALPLPAGGAEGQYLYKSGTADGAAEWRSTSPMPGGGDMLSTAYDPAGRGAPVLFAADVAVSVRAFGAKGDGRTDDSAAIQAANDSGAAAIHFPPGQYLASGLVMNTSWFMDPAAEIVFNGTLGQNCIACNGDGLSGALNLSGGGGAPGTLIYLLGNDCHFSRIAVRDMLSPADTIALAAIKLNGNNNTIDVAVGSDFVKEGSDNDSSPQFVTFGGASNGNMVGLATGHRLRTGILNYSTGENSVGTAIFYDCNDNGLYCDNTGKFTIGTLIYSGTDEPAVFINGSDAQLGMLIVNKAGNAAFDWANCVKVQIGTLIVRDPGISYLFRTRTTNVSSGTVRIGKILAEFAGIFLWWLSTALTENVTIGEADITYIYDASLSGSLGSWGRLNLASSVNIGRVDITIVDKNDVLTSSDVFMAYLPDAPTRRSRVGSFNVHIVGSDRVTLSPAGFQLRNIANSMVQIDNGRLQTNFGPYLREVNNSERSGPGLYANTMPTLGTWMRGTLLWFYGSSAGTAPGVYCTASGTFGILSGVTGSFTSGLFTGTVNNASSLIPGQYITIAGLTGVKRIVSIVGTSVKLDSAADATVSGAAVSWSPPVFKNLANMAS